MHQMKDSLRLQYILIGLLIALAYIFIPKVSAEQSTHTITISEEQEWGQIIVESTGGDVNFDVTITTPDGVTWSPDVEHDPDTLFYFADGSFRHWVSEKLVSGSYKVIIDGPAGASYRITNQNSYSQLYVELQTPQQGQYSISAANPKLEISWSYTGDTLRSNNISFWLQPVEGGERFLLYSSFVSMQKTSLSLAQDIVDGKYHLLVSYDNNTATAVELDPAVTIDVNRNITTESIEVIKLEAAGQGAYVEFIAPRLYNIASIQAALITNEGNLPYEWVDYPRAMLEEVIAPKDVQATEAYQNRYSLFIPETQAGKYKLALRPSYSDGRTGTISISEQLIDIVPIEWPEEMFSWSLDDGVTNTFSAELKVKAQENWYISIEVNGHTVLDERLQSGVETVSYELWLQEGEQAYTATIYDEYGNYIRDGRLWVVDHTAPRLEMLSPLASHATIPQQLISGWTEQDAIITINGKEITVDSTGYFSVKSKARTIDIKVTEASGNETVYHWEAEAKAFPWWLVVIILVVVVLICIAIVLYIKKLKANNEEH